MSNQDISIASAQMQRRCRPNPLSRALIKEAENDPLYRKIEEWYDSLRNRGCPVLPRDRKAALAMIGHIFRQNSSQWDYRHQDDMWCFKRRLRDLS